MSRRFIRAIAGLLVVLGPGAIYAFSLVSQPLAAAFGWKPQQVSWAFALVSLFLAVGATIGGAICDRYGPRVTALLGAVFISLGYGLCGTLAMTPALPTLLMLYLYYGVLAGTGAGMAYIAALTAVMRWPQARRGLAVGFVVMGFGLGTFVYAPIVRASGGFSSIQASTKIYTDAIAKSVAIGRPFDPSHVLMPAHDVAQLMTIFVASGIAFFILTAVAALFLSVPPRDADSSLSSDVRPGSMFADARFYVLFAILFLNVFGGSMVIGSAAPIMSELTGMSIAASAALYGTLAICNGLGRLCFGALSDIIGRRFTFAAIFAMQVVAFIVLDSTREPIGVAIAIGLVLFAYGGGFGTMPAAIADTFGTKHFGVNYGAMLFAFGFASVLGAYFVNILKTIGAPYVAIMQPLSVLALVALFFPIIVESDASSDALPAQ